MPRLIEFMAIITIAFSFGWTTFQRNFVWNDDLSLWQDVMSKSPNKARPRYNLGVIFQERGLDDKATESYQRAIALKIDYADAYTNLGQLYLKKDLAEKAVEYFKLALMFDPTQKIALFNLGIIYLEQGSIEEARTEFNAVLAIDPSFDQARQFLQYMGKQ